MNNQDLKLFKKLFKVPAPRVGNMPYYVNKLAPTAKYHDIVDRYEEFETLCEFIYEYGVQDISQLKRANEDLLIYFLKNSASYQNLNSDKYLRVIPKEYGAPNTLLSGNPAGYTYVSFDMKQANFTTFQWMADIGDPLLACRTFEDIRTLEIFPGVKEIPKLFFQSKHFRQVIFGKLKPKRQVHQQRYYMATEIYPKLVAHMSYLKVAFENVYLGHDEIVIRIRDLDMPRPEKFQSFVKQMTGRVDLRFTIFTMEDIGRSKRLKTVHYPYLKNKINKELLGVPGPTYYMYHSLLVLEQGRCFGQDFDFEYEGVDAKFKQLPTTLQQIIDRE